MSSHWHSRLVGAGLLGVPLESGAQKHCMYTRTQKARGVAAGGDVDLLVGPGPGLGGVEVGLRPGLGDPRPHLRLGDRDGGVPLGLDLLELGLLLVDQALLAVLLGEPYRHLLGLQGPLVDVDVAIVAQQQLVDLEAALGEALARQGLRLLDGLDPHGLVVERLRVELADRRQDAVAERVDDEGIHVQRAPAQVPRHRIGSSRE